MADDTEILKKLKQRKTAMRQEYDTNWRPHHRELSENLLPRAGRFLDIDTTDNDGKKRTNKVKDGVTKWALNVFCGGMHTGLTSPISPYFALTLDDKDKAKFKSVKIWLEKTREVLLSIKNFGGFYPVQHMLYYELGVFGPMVMMIDSHPDKIVHYSPLTCGEYTLNRDQYGKIDTLYRQFRMQIINVVERFGIENVSLPVKEKYAGGNVQHWVSINHAIEPNDDRIPSKIDGRNKAYRSIYWEESGSTENKLLSYRGYDTKPFVAKTLFNVGSEIYGYSPGMDALPDVKELYIKKIDRNKALAKLIGPPLNVPSTMEDGVLSVKPNAFNFFNEVNNLEKGGITPVYQINPNFGEIDLDIASAKEQIGRHFFTDIFLLLTSSPSVKTAYETAKLLEEKIKVLGPVVETAQEMQSDILEREYFLALEAGRIPEPPEELAGETIRVELISPLAQARRMIESSGIEQLTGFVQTLAATHPEAADKLNPDQAVEQYAKSLGSPTTLVRDEKEVDVIRQARQIEAQRQQEIEQNERLAAGAKNLAQADMSGKNALTELMGAQSEQ